MKHPYLLVKENVASIAQRCGRSPDEICVIAVSKKQSIESIKQAYEAGCRDFGENRIQEALTKMGQLPSDIRWHMIGTLQTNKVKKAVDSFAFIHSVDSLELARRISTYSLEQKKITPLFLQVNISQEVSKHGLSEEDWRIGLEELLKLPAIRLEGLMTMAPLTEDKNEIRRCFHRLRLLREEFQTQAVNPQLFAQLSMGMSQDYPIAIEEGATHIRIGSAIFGGH